MPGRENAKNQILHWMQCEERHLNIPAYYNLLSNSALLVEAGMGCAVCLDGALSIHADPELCFRPDLPYAYYKECDPLEEESSVFTGSPPFSSRQYRNTDFLSGQCKSVNFK